MVSTSSYIQGVTKLTVIVIWWAFDKLTEREHDNWSVFQRVKLFIVVWDFVSYEEFNSLWIWHSINTESERQKANESMNVDRWLNWSTAVFCVFRLRLTLKFCRFCSVRLATSLFTLSIVALFWIHGWFMASRADMRSSELYLRSWTTRSLASALTSSHSGSSSVYWPDSTALII